jgi:hypothetical protein
MKAREECILDAGTGPMTVRHLRLEGTNAEIGRALARIGRDRHGIDGDDLELPPEIVQARRSFSEAHYPELWARSEGVRSVFDADAPPDRLDAQTLRYNLPLPPEMRLEYGCSVAKARVHDGEDGRGEPNGPTDPTGRWLVSRNFDFTLRSFPEALGAKADELPAALRRPMMADPYVMEIYPSDGGIPALYLSSFDLLSGVIDGMNGAGLVVTLMHLLREPEEGRAVKPPQVGLNELEVLRYLLDRCETAQEAMEALTRHRPYTAWIPCQYLVTDASGTSFIFVPSEEETHFEIEAAGPQFCTNHGPGFERPIGDDGLDAQLESSLERLEILRTGIAHDRPTTEEDVRKAARKAFRTSVEEDDDRLIGATLWHALYEPEARRLRVAFLEQWTLEEHRATYTPYFHFSLDPA